MIKEHNLDYSIVETSNCSSERQSSKPMYVILVASNPSMQERRKIIRETWASPDAVKSYKSTYNVDVLVFFVMGSTDSGRHVMDGVRQEHIEHRDVIQCQFLDAYRNLTFKALCALKWTSEYCSQADYVIRVSDDVFVNGYNLFEILAPLKSRLQSSEKVIFGFVCKQGEVTVQRHENQKWYVNEAEYPWDQYPAFITAHGFILSKPAARFLYDAAITKRFFWLDDVFLTGLILIGRLDVKFVDLKKYIYVGSPFRISAGEDSYMSSIFVHMVNRTLFLEYHWWATVLAKRGLLNDKTRRQLKIAT